MRGKILYNIAGVNVEEMKLYLMETVTIKIQYEKGLGDSGSYSHIRLQKSKRNDRSDFNQTRMISADESKSINTQNSNVIH